MDARLTNNAFFNPLGPGSRAALAAASEVQVLEPGTVLFAEGDISEWLVLVLEGQVELVKRGGEGRMAVLAQVAAGDYFGELALFGGGVRTAGARVLGPATVARVPYRAVRAVLSDEPSAVTLILMGRVLEYLRAINERYLAAVINQEKMRLVADMSSSMLHDFKSPLAVIQAALGHIGRSAKDPSAARACRAIQEESERMVGLAADLMEFAQGRPTVRLQPTDLGEVLMRLREASEDYARARKVRLEVEPASIIVEADADRLLRVLQKLTANAVEAMAPGGGKLRVSVYKAGASAELRVEDDGPGIPETIKSALFEPFVTYGKKAGAGLGLAIARAVVEAHGGTIQAESAPAHGTAILIRLPLKSS